MSLHRALRDDTYTLFEDDPEARDRVIAVAKQAKDEANARAAHEKRLHDDRWRKAVERVNRRFDPPSVPGDEPSGKLSGQPYPVSEELRANIRAALGILPRETSPARGQTPQAGDEEEHGQEPQLPPLCN